MKIDHEIASLIPPIAEDEYRLLEESLLAEGCREPLVVWGDILLDGHNRFKICEDHGITYKTVQIELEDEEAARDWVINNQLGRRNLSPEAASYLRGKQYQREKKGHGGERRASVHNEHLKTADRLAEKYKVSPITIRRDEQFTEALDTIEKIADDGEKVKREILTREGPISRKSVEKIARIAKDDPDQAREVLEGVRRGDTVRQANIQIKAEAIKNEPAPMPKGPFRVIVIDPPWRYDKQNMGENRRGEVPYPDMTIEDICGLPVPEIAHQDCILWLWSTNAHMPEAFKVINALGFKHKTILTWVKDRMGVGDWLRGITEHCILAVRGQPTITLSNETTVLQAPRREHSRKPDEFYDMVEELCPGSKVELFAREKRNGWMTWGVEAGKFSTNVKISNNRDEAA